MVAMGVFMPPPAIAAGDEGQHPAVDIGGPGFVQLLWRSVAGYAALTGVLAAWFKRYGCTAALVTADESGIALKDFRAATIEDSGHAITWRIGDQGFDMHLSGEVPGKIARALKFENERNDSEGLLRGSRPADFDLWAVHAGGRTILDAVETGFELAAGKLDWSRGVLRDFGNMSSATLMFVLDRILRGTTEAADGFGVAVGPGLAAESFRFRRLAA